MQLQQMIKIWWPSARHTRGSSVKVTDDQGIARTWLSEAKPAIGQHKLAIAVAALVTLPDPLHVKHSDLLDDDVVKSIEEARQRRKEWAHQAVVVAPPDLLQRYKDNESDVRTRDLNSFINAAVFLALERESLSSADQGYDDAFKLLFVITKKQLQASLDCRLCGQEMTTDETLYHRDGFWGEVCCNARNASIDCIVPRVLGGIYEELNIQLVCNACNRSKHHHTAEQGKLIVALLGEASAKTELINGFISVRPEYQRSPVAPSFRPRSSSRDEAADRSASWI
ncbi:hypothetical protein BDZ90DRAFT_180508 [Jaminaea rosea]|uniref:Uncharacterized protein n=1 Tax=Jaminaea rosea TaxID=1569628 RepID=A0A316UQB6_9BASI|nr:hypothetical protein BDZ90DRAFT_180508 [Jaminaea rosea]PWN27486.1 hypothetical protein BDZ90DRAFT_180508 [Jaminaea rosea]